MKALKENDLINLVIAVIALAVLVNIAIALVKVALKVIYLITDRFLIDWYNIGWNAIGFAGFIIFLYGTYCFLTHDAERDHIRELTEMERNSSMMKTMEQDASYYVGYPEETTKTQKQCAQSAEAI